MRRKWANRRLGSRVNAYEFAVHYVEKAGYRGYVTNWTLTDVQEPLTFTYGDRQICAADKGYTWQQYFPAGEAYTLTVMYDAAGQVIQWYFDMCKEHGIGDDGVPWFYDLYLDILVLRTGEVMLLDEEELEAALADGIVSADEYELAWRTAKKLMDEIKSGYLPAQMEQIREEIAPREHAMPHGSPAGKNDTAVARKT
jgi:predicted RNA-binding protein associated with RNAse of E/G family